MTKKSLSAMRKSKVNDDGISLRNAHNEEIRKGLDVIVKESSHVEGKCVTLTIEPENIAKLLNTKVVDNDNFFKLTIDDFIEAVDRVIESEEDDWDSLFMKDLMTLVQEEIFSKALKDYAKNKLNFKVTEQTAVIISYLDRFDIGGNSIGKAIRFSVTNP